MVLLMKSISGLEGSLEKINIGLVSLVGCAFNEVHGITRDGENHNLVYYFWKPFSI